MRALFRIMGFPLAEAKQVDLTDECDFLGLVHDVTGAFHQDSVTFTPRASVVDKVTLS